MIPVSFPESNAVLGKPLDMTDEECSPLAVWKGKDAQGFNVIISCWKFNKEDLEEIQKTGQIWLWTYGTLAPPVALTTEHPFKQLK